MTEIITNISQMNINQTQCINPNCLKVNLPNHNFCTKCGTKLLLAGHYRVIKLLGKGGFARTFIAADEHRWHSLCVIKQFLPLQQELSTLQKAQDLFIQESLRLKELGSHPQIPNLIAYFEEDNRLYIVQEYVDGETLLARLQRQKKFSESEVREILLSLLPLLDFIHQKNIIHRDIKLENIIIRKKDGLLFLIDFGVSKQITNTIVTSIGTSIGTYGYAPSEQLRGVVFPSSDLYSLGVTCIRLLTGILPENNGNDDLFDLGEMCWRWRDKGINVSEDLGNILDKMLEELPNNRYQSAGDVLLAINQPKRVNIPVKSRVIANVSYGKFQQLLAEGKWKDADRESDRLMLEIMFRTSFNDLSDVDLSNFPCEHLQKLDQLWVKYSGGKFGFSVQNKIWLQIGGKNDYETYKKLSEYLGWRKNGQRIINKEIIFDLQNAPRGHLPTFGRLWTLKLPFLLVRLQQCKI